MTPASDAAYEVFTARVHSVLGLDLSLYRAEQMRRRLGYFLARYPGETFASLGRRLEADPAFAATVADYLTINVSEFFRNPEHFDRLRQQVIPELGPGALRMWSAGCSIGAEAYSLAMVARELGRLGTTIWATDIDRGVLARAEAGVYQPSELKEVDAQRLGRFFEPTPDNRHQVRPELRRMVRVQRHDLLHDPFPSGWDLILCRNVVIYFTEAAREVLYAGFARALRPGGVLFIGGTETVTQAADLRLQMVAPFLYRKA